MIREWKRDETADEAVSFYYSGLNKKNTPHGVSVWEVRFADLFRAIFPSRMAHGPDGRVLTERPFFTDVDVSPGPTLSN